MLVHYQHHPMDPWSLSLLEVSHPPPQLSSSLAALVSVIQTDPDLYPFQGVALEAESWALLECGIIPIQEVLMDLGPTCSDQLMGPFLFREAVQGVMVEATNFDCSQCRSQTPAPPLPSWVASGKPPVLTLPECSHL